ncbi:hypothetical protein PT974_06459 [Cladobotryum mycophilum]|uniref:Uncharacterized protein n=1 Tax=Cladobotryum mycophilum TaxID=491253 RepID=A0ABR0SMB6_9HYPO
MGESTPVTRSAAPSGSTDQQPSEPHHHVAPGITNITTDPLPPNETHADATEDGLEDKGIPGPAVRQQKLESEILAERFCTLEEKELADLVKRGLLDDEGTIAKKGDFTMEDLPQLRGDEACSVKWTVPKKKQKDSVTMSGGGGLQGLSDDEWASILQACPDLEDVIHGT